MENVRRSLKMASQNDARLLVLARSGDPTAFGLLYLRHHEAAWRVANAVTAFSAHCPGVVVEAFARVVASSPSPKEKEAVLRPALLVGVRHVALEQAGRSAAGPAPAARPGDRSSDELVLGEVEAVAVEAFRRLAEPERTALWLAAIEAFTPKEVGAVMDVSPGRAVALAVKGRHDLSAELVGVFARCGGPACRRMTTRPARI